MLFSVIIPTYNRAHLLPETLESVWRQTFTDYEVIVVDNGSTDETADYLRSLHERVRVISQPNLGPSAARNAGISAAVGTYVAFLDSDDLWFPWTLATFRSALSSHSWPTHLISSAVILSRLSAGPPRTAPSTECFEGFLDFLSSVSKSIIWSTNRAVVRRSAFSHEAHFDLDMRCFEDQDMGLQLGCARGFVNVISPPTLLYRLTSQSLTRSGPEWAVCGLNRLMCKERAGRYPGGAERSRERRAYICLSTRSLSIALAREGRTNWGWALYRNTLVWNIVLRRLRYVVGFPLIYLANFMITSWKGSRRTVTLNPR